MPGDHGRRLVELVSPERQKASEAQAQVEKARSDLATAQSTAAAAKGLSARQAEVKRSAVALKPAVPIRKDVRA